MPRKKKDEADRKSALLTFWAPLPTLELIDDWRREQDIIPSRSEVLRVALSEFMSEVLEERSNNTRATPPLDEEAAT